MISLPLFTKLPNSNRVYELNSYKTAHLTSASFVFDYEIDSHFLLPGLVFPIRPTVQENSSRKPMSSNSQYSFNRPFDSLMNRNENAIAEESEADTSQCSWVNVEPTTNVASWTHQRVLRDTNKNLRQIYEEEGLNYGKDASATELTSRLFSALKLRQASVANVLKILNASRNVQLCFLVDVTGSMATYINGVRDSIFKIVEKLTEKHVTFAGRGTAIAKKVSLAFVGYRDFCDANQFELLPFTESAEDFRQFCSKISASGGGDLPEDVFGGLKKAISELMTSQCALRSSFTLPMLRVMEKDTKHLIILTMTAIQLVTRTDALQKTSLIACERKESR
ncbi:alpha-protein kinase vwkA [Ditylenchus destructor]|uniref:Alpha-protein kinase vwkA n=1 Tax=Ditylenchus destructor TaxID=166010 RepID=A0AAD4MN41_9BILA|nr:alpha-protein kinase vwkA [Ditylenchus destructor]